MDATLQVQAVFHLTGRRPAGPLLEAIEGLGLRPAMLARYRDLARLRYDFPLVLVDPAPGGPFARSLTDLVNEMARTTAPAGPSGEALRKHLLHVEREAVEELLVRAVDPGGIRVHADDQQVVGTRGEITDRARDPVELVDHSLPALGNDHLVVRGSEQAHQRLARSYPDRGGERVEIAFRMCEGFPAGVTAMLALAKYPNIGVKMSGAPSYSSDPYPYRNIHGYLKQIFEAFGPDRCFWGTDITRMPCTYKQCVTMFTEEMPWLKGRDKELVMGKDETLIREFIRAARDAERAQSVEESRR